MHVSVGSLGLESSGSELNESMSVSITGKGLEHVPHLQLLTNTSQHKCRGLGLVMFAGLNLDY